MKRSKSSQEWLQRHVNDHYVKMAKKKGYRSRAVFKLQEIQDKKRVIKPGHVVVDLGAAPGSWSQIAVPMVGRKGAIIAMDILPMDPLDGVDFILGDFMEQAVHDELLEVINGRPVDLVMSDIAPNITGLKAIDQPRSMYLAELALAFSREVLKPGGDFLVKVFQGEGFDTYLKEVRSSFTTVSSRKPKASRPKSREIYILAQGLKTAPSV